MWQTGHTEETTASPKAVWAVVANVEGWSAWNPGYREAHLDGPIEPGTPGRVVLANGMERPFTLVEARLEASFIIGASGPGIKQRFIHSIESLPNGGSRVSMAATMQGPLTAVFSRMFGKIMAGYYPKAVRQLVATAEGRTFTSATHS